ncbi:dTMP kinase [Paenibacillus xanthanilyticus]|uniref:Thymidylate kinase n=1 Tax=Paenibacillus xanthanilyticus TaxID=1783531 RepID=A0ABV8JX06_9BACL
MHTGIFITIEGGEGAGKTTLIETLAHRLEANGLMVVKTREPGGIPIAEQIRGIILDRANTMMDPRTEALLYAAARRQHLVEKVEPALAQGAVVICDRFVDSSLAYQGHARGLGLEEVRAINAFAIHDTMPDLTLYLDITPEAGLRRIHASEEASREINRLDLEALSFHQLVREGYLQLYQSEPERIVKLDAEQPKTALAEAAWTAICRRLEEKGLSVSK